MSIGIGAAASFGTYALPVKAPGPTHSVDPAQAAHQAVKTQAKVAAAQETLANANSIVDQDKRNHSPGCVACDQKLVDKAQAQLAQIKASANDEIKQASPSPGSTVDFTI